MKITTRKTMGDSYYSPISDQVKLWRGYIYCELGTANLYQVVFGIFGLYLVKEV